MMENNIDTISLVKGRGRRTSKKIPQQESKATRGRGRPPNVKDSTVKENQSEDMLRQNIVENNSQLAEPKEGYKAWIRTPQSGIIKTLVEALKESLIETNIKITTKMIKINQFDEQYKRILLDLKLYGGRFEEFRVKEKFCFRVDIQNLFKLVKNTPSYSIITLFIEDREPVEELGIIIENPERNSRTTYRLSLPSLENVGRCVLESDDSEYSNTLTLPTGYFQRLCRDMKVLSNQIEIKTSNSRLYLNCKSDFAAQETIVSPQIKYLNFIRSSENGEIAGGTFCLDDIIAFTKCASLSKTVKLMLGNKKPLCIQYDIGSLGEIKVYITCL